VGSRVAVAATITSILVFSTLLVANEVVYNSANQQLTAAYISAYEREEALTARLLVAEAAFNASANAQAILARNPPTCESWSAYSEGLSQRVSTMVTRGGVTYHLDMNLSYAQSGSHDDNLTTLSPFEGFEDGSLNMIARVRIRASAGPEYPSFAKTEVHYLHLPVPLEVSISLCSSALRDISGLLGSDSCSPGAVQDLVSQYEALAKSQGVRITLEGAQGFRGVCSGASYEITVSEDSVQGFAGRFDWRMSALIAPT
jgi:hypothetical protein